MIHSLIAPLIIGALLGYVMGQPTEESICNSMTLIDAKNITLCYDGKTILDDVSLRIGAADFLTIIGPNGAGKSTLLKVMMGLVRAGSGAVVRQKNLRIGYMPQGFRANPSMPISVARFLDLTGAGAGAESGTEFETLAELAQIESLLDKPLQALSGGERQRVLLAQALAAAPQLLILDEPAQNLDLSGQLAFYALLDAIHRDTKTSILMVSHDLHMVMASTRQVVCLYRHICCSGEPQMVARDPEFQRLFGDNMAEMMAVYHHQHDHSHGAHGEDA